MNYIKGKLKKIIFQNQETGYMVALFRVKETNEKELSDKVNKTITVTGVFNDANLEIMLILYGEYVFNERFGMQYVVNRYEVELPSTEDSIIEFLASSFIESCGEKTAKKIVEVFGSKTLDKIKEDQNNLLQVAGMTPIRAAKIYNSLINYSKSSDFIIKLQYLGFSIDECSRIYNKFKNRMEDVLADAFYDMKEVVDFTKLDSIYITHYGADTNTRIYACILEVMALLSRNQGDTFYYKDEIIATLSKSFNILLEEDIFDEKIDDLQQMNKVLLVDRRYYLMEYYEKEVNIANTLKRIDHDAPKKIAKLDEKIENLEKRLNISYNEEQKKAIKGALNNNITIISGGPGTGKTTIINAIVRLYIEENKLGPTDILETIALLAPTGRASKKMSSSTALPASTIHRYLKWYKDSNDFYYNIDNKTGHRFIIVDEVSMIDIDLFNALLNGISNHVKLILVGDIFQLPSVGPGLVLNDLIDSDYFNFVPLNQIYRQSNNSYIPFLAKEIKTVDLSEEFMVKKDDYSFFQVPSLQIKSMIEQVIKISQEKNIDERKMQILAPMYKGENGIDNLNLVLQQIYNPEAKKKEEILYGDVVFREGDKVLQLINALEENVFNGDIGYIERITGNTVVIDFEGNKVEYQKKDLKQIKHAYAITIHKSQGSEFEHVIMPVCKSYYKMLYNKLIYTGVSRAKKSLTIIGDANAFMGAVKNNYSMYRKTSLKERIIDVYSKEL